MSIVVAGHAHVGSLSDCANLRASMEVASTYRVDPFRRLDHVRERLTLVRGPEPNDRKIEASQGAGNAAEGAMLTWRKIGCAMDFSEHSRLAMLKASELAHRLDADLELIHVHVLPMPVGDVVVTPEDLGAMALAEIENRSRHTPQSTNSHTRAWLHAAPPSQPKSDVSDFGRSIEWPNSGLPEFGCKRGRE